MLERDSFRIQTERSRFFVARATNRHIEQDDSILLADHPIRFAIDYFITVPAEEFHSH